MTYERPLSPHLQIYKPQLTSVLSILHRLTGIALSLGTIPLTLWIITLTRGEADYNCLVNFFGSWFGQFLLFGWTYCFFYHLANGIRHLFWDAGYGFDLKSVYTSGWFVVIISIALSSATWIYAYSIKGDGL